METVNAASVAKANGLYPVKLLRNYRPEGEFEIQVRAVPNDPESELIFRRPQGRPAKMVEGEEVSPPGGEWAKAIAGMTIKLPKDEAKRIVAMKIAEVSTSVFD